MQDSSLDNFIVGALLTVVGLAVVVLHRSIRERLDWWNSRGWPVGLGDAWTGKYTLGGLIFTYAVIILLGVVLVVAGIFQIMRAF